DVAARIVKWFVEGTIWRHLWITLVEALLAFVIGSLGGVLVGFWFARQPLIAAVFDPYVKMINALPRVVLAPIFALWLGLGIWSKVALGVTLVFFIVFFNVYQGVKEVSPTILANARMLGMSEQQLMRHVYWPSALSWMFSSLHTSVGFAVVGAVVGEYLGSAAGLGYIIQQAEGVFDVAGVFAGMFVLAAFVIVIDALVTAIERRLLVWRPAAAETRPRCGPTAQEARMIKPTAIDPSVANPPRINGQVPDDYRGPLYYRVQSLTYYGGKKPLHALLSYEDRGVRRRLAKVDLSRAALRRDPVLCDADSDLRAEWRAPIKGQVWAAPRKNWEEFDRIVSSRVRDVIEEFAPGIHYFVPVDIDDRQGGFRAYFFFCGLGWTRDVVAAEASGITDTTTVGAGRISAF